MEFFFQSVCSSLLALPKTILKRRKKQAKKCAMMAKDAVKFKVGTRKSLLPKTAITKVIEERNHIRMCQNEAICMGYKSSIKVLTLKILPGGVNAS